MARRGHKSTISPIDAHKRTKKGWETKRHKYSSRYGKARNVYKVAPKEHVWVRPNDEIVTLHNFTDNQVRKVSPAFANTDKYLRPHQKLDTYIAIQRPVSKKAEKVMQIATLSTAKIAGGAARSKDEKELKGLNKSVAKFMGLDHRDFGHINSIKLPEHAINTKKIKPAGVMAHEIGHLVGPGKMSKRSAKEINEFEDAFQWVAPRRHKGKGLVRYDKGQIDKELSNISFAWKMRADHPHAKGVNRKGALKGTAKSKKYVRQAAHYDEDFAETYRSLIGVPIASRHTKRAHFFNVKDKKNSRKKYMRKYHLSGTA